MQREEIIARNPILEVCQDRYLMKFTRQGGEFYSPCPFHTDGKRPNFRVNLEKQTWFCDVCNDGGSVIDLVMRKERLDAANAMKALGGNGHSQTTEPVEVAWYDYTDENGKLLYQVVRYVPKTFKQRHKGPNGAWIWNMDGVRRVLYQLPKVLNAEALFICEGEKDCDNLGKLGLLATCNVSGACHWLDSYSDTLKGKAVFIWPDRDKKGEEHYDTVVKSLTGKAKAIFRFDVEDKDASDFVARLGDKALSEIEAKMKSLKPLNLEADLPIKSTEEMEVEYQEFVKKFKTRTLDLSRFIPSMNHYVRPIVPGELVCFLADTGQGKTALLQNLAMAARLPVLIFELELPSTLMFERFLQIQEGVSGEEVFNSYQQGEPIDWRARCQTGHIFVCPMSRLNPDEMERIIEMSELKIGVKPSLVMVDYVGLVTGKGNSRYERMSDVAEQLKIVAKKTDTIIIMASQVMRKDRSESDYEITLHDAKDSGSIENSAGLLIGCWRSQDPGILNLKILKNTKGSPGKVIPCNFNGRTLKITEQTTVKQGENIP